MRTTLTLDDDVATKLKALAHRQKVSLKEAVNTVLRRGLAAQDGAVKRKKPFRVETFRSAFLAGVDPFRLNQLSDEIEVDRNMDHADRSRP